MHAPRRVILQGLASLPLLAPERAEAAAAWSKVWSAATYATRAQLDANRPPFGYPANRRFSIGISPGGQKALTETIGRFDPFAPKVNGFNPTYVWHLSLRLPRIRIPVSAKGYAARNYIHLTDVPRASGIFADGKWDSLCIGVAKDSKTGGTNRDRAASLMTYFWTDAGYCQIVCGFEGITPNNGIGAGYHYLAEGGGGGRIDPGRWYCVDRYMVPESRAGGQDGAVWIDIDGTTVAKFPTCQFFEPAWWGHINYMHESIRHMWGGNEDEYPPDYPFDRPMKQHIKNASRYVCMSRSQALSLKLPAPVNYN